MGGSIYAMSTAHSERIPTLTLGWRLKMSLTDSGLSRDDMARDLGVTPSTISRWMSDKTTPPARAFVVRWAQLTHVSQEWLEHGVVVSDPTPPEGEPVPDEGGSALDELAARKRARRARRTTDGYPFDSAAA